ncbi:MAG: L-aspartate oxidase [Anaerolineae bacterium]|nr:L-aspartate oxidase [Anaerolineae bacterium]
MSADIVESDVLVIGCGIAGAVTALRLAEDPTLSITVITSAADPLESNTFYAQGGIIGGGVHDSPALLAQDLIAAGAGLNNRRAVRILATEGPRLVEEFLVRRLGVPFARSHGDQLEYIREAAHSTERILHAADATGQAIQTKLMEALRARPNVRILPSHTAVDLLTPSHHAYNRLRVYEPLSCGGAYVLNQAQNRVDTFLAKATVLATGGLGRIFLHTTNPPLARGDGLAMAARAGARIINAEYVQFHPTVFFHLNAAQFLISEAVRGAGARLINNRGKPFMEKYAPQWKDLAPRDVVARSIHQEMLATGANCVYLDLASYINRAKILRRFPNIYETCLKYGVDITKEPVPVVPAAHYFCGGVWADSFGRTTIRNLYAVGEVSCTGVHGANRLGSASLLEGLVWGWRAAGHIRQTLPKRAPLGPTDLPPWRDVGLEDFADPALIQQDLSTIQHIMWNYVGLIRSTKRLERAINDLYDLQDDITRFYRTTRLNDALVGLRNAVQAAIIVAEAAWRNRESSGCHFRLD